MRKTAGIMYGLAECQDCGWRNTNHKNAQATGAIHARAHRHLVLVDTGCAINYDGREGPA